MPAIEPIRPDSLLPILRGDGFVDPTYTQTPNDLFAILPDLTGSQVKVLLAIVRDTIGDHQTQAEESLTDLQHNTGLGRMAVVSAFRRLSRGDIITRTRRPAAQGGTGGKHDDTL